MNIAKFLDLTKKMFKDCLDIMKSKGEAYSGLEDKLGNFKRVARNLGMTPYQVWSVYFDKHIDAIHAWIRQEYKDSEPIEGRIMDAINYLFLLNGLIHDKEGILDIPMPDPDPTNTPIYNEEGHSNEED